MTTTSKEHHLIWSRLLALANYDEKLMEEAQNVATDPLGRICLRGMKRHIMSRTNPALLATLEAAGDFARAVNYSDRMLSLPHLRRIYDLAERDTRLPRKILEEAAENCRSTPCPALEDVIEASIVRHEKAPKRVVN